eukprot:g21487.t1
MYITDADVLDFLRRAIQLLAPAGTLVVKENVAQSRVGSYFDDEEGELWRHERGAKTGPMSVLRTPEHYLKLFRECGFVVVMRRRQFFSNDEMPMAKLRNLYLRKLRALYVPKVKHWILMLDLDLDLQWDDHLLLEAIEHPTHWPLSRRLVRCALWVPLRVPRGDNGSQEF